MTPDKAKSLANDIACAIETLRLVADELLTAYPSGDYKAGEPLMEEPKAKPPTLEEVRKVLAEKSRDGHTAAIRELLEKYGAAKLSDIAPIHFKDLLKDAEGLK